jgi:enoyl-CoA hydratase
VQWALQRGFLARVVADADLPAEALASARRVMALAPQAARLNKRTLRHFSGAFMPDVRSGGSSFAMDSIVKEAYHYADSAEHREGISAFLAKRAAVF